jgi:hypothetical protein
MKDYLPIVARVLVIIAPCTDMDVGMRFGNIAAAVPYR